MLGSTDGLTSGGHDNVELVNNKPPSLKYAPVLVLE
jgi:hypothetical protein